MINGTSSLIALVFCSSLLQVHARIDDTGIRVEFAESETSRPITNTVMVLVPRRFRVFDEPPPRVMPHAKSVSSLLTDANGRWNFTISQLSELSRQGRHPFYLWSKDFQTCRFMFSPDQTNIAVIVYDRKNEPCHTLVLDAKNRKLQLRRKASERSSRSSREFVVESIERKPLILWYGAFYEPPIPSGGPLGIHHVQIPTNAVPKIGKEVEGFKLVGVEEKFEMKEMRGKKLKVDVSELLIQHGNQTFKMRKGIDQTFYRVTVRVRHVATGKVFALIPGDTFSVGTKAYTLQQVDTKADSCVLIDRANNSSIKLSGEKGAGEGE